MYLHKENVLAAKVLAVIQSNPAFFHELAAY